MTLQLTPHTNCEWGNIEFSFKGQLFYFPTHLKSGEVYNIDPAPLIRLKCAALIGLTPFITLTRSVGWVAETIFMVLREFYRYLEGEKITQERRQKIADKAADSLRALQYGMEMTGICFYGIFNPLEARMQYGKKERELNRHVDGPHRDKYYAAFCFQRLTHLSSKDPDYVQLDKRLTKYLTSIYTIFDTLSFDFWKFFPWRSASV